MSTGCIIATLWVEVALGVVLWLSWASRHAPEHDEWD